MTLLPPVLPVADGSTKFLTLLNSKPNGTVAVFRTPPVEVAARTVTVKSPDLTPVQVKETVFVVAAYACGVQVPLLNA